MARPAGRAAARARAAARSGAARDGVAMRSYRPEVWLAAGFWAGMCEVGWVLHRHPATPAALSALAVPSLVLGAAGALVTTWVGFLQRSASLSPENYPVTRWVAPFASALAIGVSALAAGRHNPWHEHVAVASAALVLVLAAVAFVADAVKGPALLCILLAVHCCLVLGTVAPLDPVRSIRWAVNAIRSRTPAGGDHVPVQLPGDRAGGATDRVRQRDRMIKDLNR